MPAYISNIIQDFAKNVRKILGNSLDSVIVYGSYARGDFTKESDIDVLILLNCDKEQVMKYRKQISRLSSRIGLKNDVEVSLLLRNRETFEKQGDTLPFYKNVKKEGVALYE